MDSIAMDFRYVVAVRVRPTKRAKARVITAPRRRISVVSIEKIVLIIFAGEITGRWFRSHTTNPWRTTIIVIIIIIIVQLRDLWKHDSHKR